MKKIEYYLDCSSPWTYLSFRGILDLQRKKDFEIIWKPILVGGIFNSINPSVYESRKNPVKEKAAYSQKDLKDWSELRGIVINWPTIFPVNSVKAMRGAFYFIDNGGIALPKFLCSFPTSIPFLTAGLDLMSSNHLLTFGNSSRLTSYLL